MPDARRQTRTATSAGERLATAATSLIGSPFRLGGRDPATGLDCVGLVYASLRIVGCVPVDAAGYCLRNLSVERWLPLADRNGFTPTTGAPVAGDIQLCRPGAGQHHLIIWQTPACFIHAHAGLRRVCATPAPLPWPSAGHWCLRWQRQSEEPQPWQP